jgi:hypothetical protein
MTESQESKCQHAHGTLGELIARIRENLQGEREGGTDQMHRDLDEAQRCLDECAAGCECSFEDPAAWAYLSAGVQLTRLRKDVREAIQYLKHTCEANHVDADVWRTDVAYRLDQAVNDSPTLSERRAELLTELESAVSLCSLKELQKLGSMGNRVYAAIIQCIEDHHHAQDVRNKLSERGVTK